MRRTIAVNSAVTALAVILVALGASRTVHAQATGTVIGAWELTVNVNTPPGAPPFIVTEVGTFNLGGTFADTISIAHSSQNPYIPAPLAVDFSDAYGAWRRPRAPISSLLPSNG